MNARGRKKLDGKTSSKDIPGFFNIVFIVFLVMLALFVCLVGPICLLPLIGFRLASFPGAILGGILYFLTGAIISSYLRKEAPWKGWGWSEASLSLVKSKWWIALFENIVCAWMEVCLMGLTYVAVATFGLTSFALKHVRD